MTINFRPAEKKDIPQLTILFNQQYARKKDEAQILWQYFNSFYPTVCFCAFSGNQLVGAFTIQKRRLSDGTIIGHFIDLLVALEWRSQRVFTALGARAIKCFPDLEAVSVLPNQNGKGASEKAFGLRTLAKIDDLVIHNLPPTGEANDIAPQEKLVRYQGGPEYENWRYNQNPRHRYEQITLPDGSYAIAKLFIDPRNGEKFWDIVDYQLYNPSKLAKLFLTAIQRLLEKDGAGVSIWALPHTALYQPLRNLGFVPLARERYFCVKVLSPKREYLYNINHWELVMADAEIY